MVPQPNLPVFDGDLAGDFFFLKQALDDLFGSDPGLSERYKFQVLVDQIKFLRALMNARSYMHEAAPYTRPRLARLLRPHRFRTSALRYSLSAPLLGYIYLYVRN